MEVEPKSDRQVGEIPPKRIIQCATSACRIYNPECSVANCEEKPFSTESFDVCDNRSNQRHNFTQAQKRKVDGRRWRCAASLFQESGFQSAYSCTRNRRRIRQMRQVHTPKNKPFQRYAKNMAISSTYPVQSGTSKE